MVGSIGGKGFTVTKVPKKTFNVTQINSIKTLYGDIRQDSKPVTFALTYSGTYVALMGSGLDEDNAKRAEANYHKLYAVSDEWKNSKLEQAKVDGYVTLAFGVRLRCNLIGYKGKLSYAEQYALEAEKRSVGNALTQSYGFLNTRSVNEFMDIVWNSKYRYTIKPAAQIHDSSYYVTPDTIEAVKFVNDNLIPCMCWDDLPELKHPEVKLSSELEVFIDWSTPIKYENNATLQEIADTTIAAGKKYRKGNDQ